MRSGFPDAGRASAVEAARAAVNETSKTKHGNEQAKLAWKRAVETFRRCLEEAYPPGFWDAYDHPRQGDAAYLETAIQFLEADPMFFRSGYIKAYLI